MTARSLLLVLLIDLADFFLFGELEVLEGMVHVLIESSWLMWKHVE